MGADWMDRGAIFVDELEDRALRVSVEVGPDWSIMDDVIK